MFLIVLVYQKETQSEFPENFRNSKIGRLNTCKNLILQSQKQYKRDSTALLASGKSVDTIFYVERQILEKEIRILSVHTRFSA